MSDKPSWMSQDEWANLMANPAREAESGEPKQRSSVSRSTSIDSRLPRTRTRNPQPANVGKAKERAVEDRTS